VLELLLRSGVSTVAEAVFQDHSWRPELDKLRSLAEIRVVHCTVAADVAFARITRREQDDPLRRVHAAPRDAAGHEARTARSAG
jgi:predicted kinase